MKGLLWNVIFGSFLVLVGLQAAHVHAGQATATCAVCALAQQAQRHVPANTVCLEIPRAYTAVAPETLPAPEAAVLAPRQARGPPSRS